MAYYYEKKVSDKGPVVKITDGANGVPLRDWEVTIPTNTKGYSSIDAVNSLINIISVKSAHWEQGNINTSGADSTGNEYVRTNRYFDIKGGATYDISGIETPAVASDFRIFFYDESYTFISYKNYGSTPRITPDNARYFRLRDVATDNKANLQIEYGSETSAHTVYFPPEITNVSLGRTVYGGAVNLVRGTGTTKIARIKVSDLNWTYYTGGTNPIFYANYVPDSIGYSTGDTPNVALDGFTVYNATTRSNLSKYMPDNNISFISSAPGTSVAIRYTEATSKNDMLAALGDYYISYEVITDIAFTFNPISPLPSTDSDRVIWWADAGDSQITYYIRKESDLEYIIKESTLTNIADAIRTKRESYSPILTEDMADEIMAITTGGGSKTPVTLSFTEIGNDDNKTGTITFTDDYHNYPLIKCKMVNTNNQSEQEIIITPQFIDDAFQYSNNRLNFNFKSTDIYAYYSLNNGNWVRGGQRSCCVTKVYGVSSSLNEIEVTNLYRYQSSNSGNRTITFEGSVYDYQYLLIGICDGDTTETQGSPAWIIIGNPGIETFTDFHVYYGYNSSPMLFSMTEHGLTAQNTARFGFFTVDGINFT